MSNTWRRRVTGGVQGAREHGIGDQLLGGELGEAGGGRLLRSGGDGNAGGPLADDRGGGGYLGNCRVLGELAACPTRSAVLLLVLLRSLSPWACVGRFECVVWWRCRLDLVGSLLVWGVLERAC